jgi:hypothetical protein
MLAVRLFMNHGFLSALCLLCLCGSGVAQEVQARAEQLLQHARQLSDIRSPNAPPFRLKATFSFTGDDLDTVQGTYTETWFSDSQWRRETVIRDQLYIEVRGGDRHWLLFPEGFPVQANKLPTLMTVLPPASLDLKFQSVNERTSANVTAECAFTRPVLVDFGLAFCFEKKSGVLLEKVFPEKRPRNLASWSCEYGKFQKFGDYAFPREVSCFEDRHKAISASVTDISIAPPMDPALFGPPAEAIELGQCSGKTVLPAASGGGFMSPALDLENVAWLKVWLVVDAKGKPQNLRVLRPADKHTYEKAWNMVRDWHFRPGTCDGKPISMPLALQIPFTPR